jgi:6-phosphogluconolactonase
MAGIGPDVRVFTDAESLSQAAASIFTETAGEAIQQRGQCRISLSGGDSPQRLYAILAASPQRDLVVWEKVHFFWGDERCVPSEDINSNYHVARELLLSHVGALPENIHRVRTELEPDLAAQDYSLTLNRHAEPPLKWPRFDLVLLGLGDDGHTASLFPHASFEAGQTAVAVHQSGAKPPGWRVSLTPEVFNSARKVMFLVEGAHKSAIAASVVYGAFRPDLLPAQQIRPSDGDLIWLMDAGAASG